MPEVRDENARNRLGLDSDGILHDRMHGGVSGPQGAIRARIGRAKATRRMPFRRQGLLSCGSDRRYTRDRNCYGS